MLSRLAIPSALVVVLSACSVLFDPSDHLPVSDGGTADAQRLDGGSVDRPDASECPDDEIVPLRPACNFGASEVPSRALTGSANVKSVLREATDYPGVSIAVIEEGIPTARVATFAIAYQDGQEPALHTFVCVGDTIDSDTNVPLEWSELPDTGRARYTSVASTPSANAFAMAILADTSNPALAGAWVAPNVAAVGSTEWTEIQGMSRIGGEVASITVPGGVGHFWIEPPGRVDDVDGCWWAQPAIATVNATGSAASYASYHSSAIPPADGVVMRGTRDGRLAVSTNEGILLWPGFGPGIQLGVSPPAGVEFAISPIRSDDTPKPLLLAWVDGTDVVFTRVECEDTSCCVFEPRSYTPMLTPTHVALVEHPIGTLGALAVIATRDAADHTMLELVEVNDTIHISASPATTVDVGAGPLKGLAATPQDEYLRIGAAASFANRVVFVLWTAH